MNRLSRRSLLGLSILAACLAWQQAAIAQAKGSLKAAIVPKADIIAVINAKAAANSPLGQRLRAKADALQPATGAQKNMADKIKAASGLTDTDILAAIVSASLAGIDFDAPQSLKPGDINFVAAIKIAKPLSIDKLVAVFNAITEDSQDEVTVGKGKIGSHAVAQIVSKDTTEPSLFAALSDDKKVVYVSLNKGALTGTLTRAAAGKSE